MFVTNCSAGSRVQVEHLPDLAGRLGGPANAGGGRPHAGCWMERHELADGVRVEQVVLQLAGDDGDRTGEPTFGSSRGERRPIKYSRPVRAEHLTAEKQEPVNTPCARRLAA